MDSHDRTEHNRPANRGKWVLFGFLAVAAYFLWTEHQAHLMSALPYLLLLACPLMHMFHHGHGGHGHHHGNHDGSVSRDANRPQDRTGEKS